MSKSCREPAGTATRSVFDKTVFWITFKKLDQDLMRMDISESPPARNLQMGTSLDCPTAIDRSQTEICKYSVKLNLLGVVPSSSPRQMADGALKISLLGMEAVTKLVFFTAEMLGQPDSLTSLPPNGESSPYIWVTDHDSTARCRALRFSTHEGFAIHRLLAVELKIPCVALATSAEFLPLIERRSRQLKFNVVTCEPSEKAATIIQFCADHGISVSQALVFDAALSPSDFPGAVPTIFAPATRDEKDHFMRMAIERCGDIRTRIVAHADDYRLPNSMLPQEIRSGRRPIRALLSDIDGTLTNGWKWLGDDGSEWKCFSKADVETLKKWNDTGNLSFLITNDPGTVAAAFAPQCQIPADHVFGGAVTQKVAVLQTICLEHGLKLGEIAYIGDDINDIGILEQVIKENGVGACPRNAVPDIKNVSGIHRLESEGGSGALTEFVEIILQRFQ
jgi:YrbI family 3-deoxy-D-manno-octulosonate 8-phosphate phosphatase